MSSSALAAPGLLFVVSAPSATGKTTVVERLVQVVGGLVQSRSYTSRPVRANEADGVDYNFVSRSTFDAMVARGEFLEWADVFGNCYGTRRQDTEAILASGADVVLVIDVQGARQVRSQVAGTVGIFVLPPSFEILERRLRARSQDLPEAMARRLATSRTEIDAVDEYDYIVVNDELERCVAEIAAIVVAERARKARRRPLVEPIVKTFRTE